MKCLMGQLSYSRAAAEHVRCGDFHHVSHARVQGGRVGSKEAKQLSAKPNHRAMPVSFRTCLILLRYWQAPLLEALVEIK